MPIKPHKDETQSEFMSRCVPEMIGTGPDKRPQEQAVAACLQIWRNNKKAIEDVVDPPEDDESKQDFIDRCVDALTSDDDSMDEDDANDQCEVMWDERSGDKAAVQQKTHASNVEGMEFILSDETPDRLGDVISAAGWDIRAFQKNPIALFGHLSSFPIGKWKNLRVEGTELRGHLVIAPEGTSPRIDEIRRLIDADILRAVSVGFRPLEMAARRDDQGKWLGDHFIKQELIETSLVSVPANPNALAVAKSLKISPETMDLVFAKHGNRNVVRRRGLTGKHAITSRNGKGSAMSLAQRISDVQTKLVDRKDKLAEHWGKVDDNNVTDAELQTSNDLNAEIAQFEKQFAALMESEKLLAKTADNGGRSLVTFQHHQEPRNEQIAAPAIIKQRKKDLDLVDLLTRAATVAYCAKAWSRNQDEARIKIYGEDEATKVMCELTLKAASAPALTTVTGWAAELVQQTYTELMPLLMPKAILTRLAAKGLALNFGRAGKIIIPTRNRTPTIAGSFVGEGMAIPVRQGAFSAQTLVPKKMAVITVWSKEMDDHSIPAIEGLLREAIQEDTTVATDSVLIDANAATTIRPAGLLNGVAALTATAGGGIAAVVGDIKQMVGALAAATYGNVRTPVWMMNFEEVQAASLASAANTGIFPFRDEIGRGTLNGIPIIDSATVPLKTVILVDAADFVVVGGESPRMEMSDQATLHMEDTTPLDLVAGSPGVVAAPQRSLFQTDLLALRMVMPLNWLQRRTGTVVWTQNVTW